MLILIDGYNVIAPVAPPRRGAAHWLQRERMRLLRRLVEQLDADLARQTCVVFDAPHRRSQAATSQQVEGIEVRFAVDHAEADDLIEQLIAAHHSPKRLAVVSSDHRLQAAARRAGATAFDSEPWLEALLAGRVLLAVRRRPDGPGETAVDEAKEETGLSTRQWLELFGLDEADQRESDDPPRHHQPDELGNPFPEGYGEDLLP